MGVCRFYGLVGGCVACQITKNQINLELIENIKE